MIPLILPQPGTLILPRAAGAFDGQHQGRRDRLQLAPGVARLKSITMMAAAANTPPVAMPPPALTPPQGQLPFRRVTIERNTNLPSEINAMTAATIPIERTIEGTGFLYGIRLKIQAVASGNSANVVFAEDAPHNAINSLVLRDVNGEVCNFPNGWYAYLANVVNRLYANRWLDNSALWAVTPGASGSGGSFTIWIDVPVATNRRDLLGLLGNQDRAQKYSLRTDMAPSGNVYTTAPTALPQVTISKYYLSYSVPMPQGPNGAQQAIVPDNYGAIRYTTVTTMDAAPQGGQTVNHYLRRIGNTIRWVALVFRSNGSRITADANAPTQITFKVGDDTLFVEDYAFRRSLMFERWGFDLPAGVLVYDAMHDFGPWAGFEVGDDYYHTQALVNAQFQIAYPAGFGSTNNSLNVVTDDLAFSQPS